MNSLTRLEDIGVIAPSPQEVDLGRLLRNLWRQRLVIAVVVALVVSAAALILSTITPIYSASTKVMIDTRQSALFTSHDSVDITPVDMAVMSEVEVMYSRNIAKRVADKLNLYDDKNFNPALQTDTGNRLFSTLSLLLDEWATLFPSKRHVEPTDPDERERQRKATVVDEVLGSLRVDPIQQSTVIRIRIDLPDPVMATKLADAYARAYIDEQLESRFESIRYISTWLNGRLESLRGAVDESERAVAAYRSQNGLLDEPGHSSNQQQLSELNTQLITAQAKRADTQARLARIEAAMQAGRNLDLLEDMVDSPLTQRLKEQAATLARTVTNLHARYGSAHPEMVKAQAELTQVQSQLSAEIDNVVNNMRNDFALQKQREASILNQIRSVESAVLFNKKSEIKLRELEREAQADRILYEAVLSKFKESGEEALIKQANARIIAPADLPDGPSYPRKRAVLAAAAILGLLGGIGLVLVLEQLDRTIRTRDHLEDLVGLPTFALIPQIKSGTDENLVQSYVIDHPTSSYTEALRMAWVGLQHNSGPGHVIVVTSSVPEEGKSLTVISLARVIAAHGLRVAVIDADLRRASIAAKSGIQPVQGITDVIRGTITFEEAMVRDPLSSVDLLPGTKARGDDINLLAASENVSALFAALRQSYDMIIVDSPPALAVADVQVLARLADQTLFCVRWDQTTREIMLSAIRTLRDARAKISGTLLTRVNLRKHAKYGYHDIGYYYSRYRNYYSER